MRMLWRYRRFVEELQAFLEDVESRVSAGMHPCDLYARSCRSVSTSQEASVCVALNSRKSITNRKRLLPFFGTRKTLLTQQTALAGHSSHAPMSMRMRRHVPFHQC